MKKLWTAALLLLMNAAYALPLGNPSEASLFLRRPVCDEQCSFDFVNFGVGFYGDYVFNRHMETMNGKDIDNTRIYTNAGYLSLGFCERGEFFTALGASRLSLNTSLGAFNAADPHPLFELETASAFSYSVGARLTLFHYRCANLGVVGQYFSTRPNVKRLYIAAGAVSYPGDTLKTHYSEWQVGAGLSYRYNDFFVPYIGVKAGHSFWRLNDGNNFVIETNTGTFLYNLKNQNSWGYVVGLSLCPLVCERLAVTVEARFPNEKALYVNGQMRF